MTIGSSATLAQKFGRAFMDAALAEDGLQDDGGGIVVNRRAQSFDVVARNELDILEERLESLAVLVLPSQRHGAESSTVIRTFQSDEFTFRFSADSMSGETGK